MAEGRHDLRHFAATLHLAAGVDIKIVHDMVGHSSRAITYTTSCPTFARSRPGGRRRTLVAGLSPGSGTGHTRGMAYVLCPVVVGRDAELGVLRAALSAAVGGAGGLAFLTGEAGIGKSRLVREMDGDARAREVSVVAGRAVPGGASTPYRPLTEALLQALRDRGVPDDPDLVPWLPALGAIVPHLSGEAHGDATPTVRGEAVLRLLRQLARPGALVVLLEDLHWADPDTLALIEYLGDSMWCEPLLCVATCRSQQPSPALDLVRRMQGRRGVTHLSLGRLDDDQVTAMVAACMPGAGLDVVARVQHAAEGVPFLVEEVLASPGVPGSFADTVRVRMAALGDDERRVLQTAAVIGRHFDWRLLSAATGLAADLVTVALEHGVGRQLLTVQGEEFRYAVVEELLPPARAALAGCALAAVETAHPELDGSWRDVAADLAARSGDRGRAGVLLTASGSASLERGALATAVGTLQRAVGLLDDSEGRAAAEAVLVEALALAGRVEEAMAVGDRLIAQLGRGGGVPAARVEVHLQLAHAAAAATRWPAASLHLDAARTLLAAVPQPGLAARAAVLEAEVAFAGNDVDDARRLAESVLTSGEAGPDVCCHALELIGRTQRINDLDAARQTFERALSRADAAHLEIWRLRALHELGTIELFDHAGTRRLAEARRTADDLGALSTAAVLDIQLSAAYLFRFALDEAADYARSALAISERLGMGQIRAVALVFLGEISGLRQDSAEMERFFALAAAAAPGEPEIEGSAWGGGRAMMALLGGDTAGAVAALGRGVSLLNMLPQQGPAHYRGLWPLLLASADDERAPAAIDEARRLGVTVNRVNRGMLGYATAILAGRRGEPELAADAARAADADLAHYPLWGDLARLQAAVPALAGGWGQPRTWLQAAQASFAAHGIDALAARCAEILAGPPPGRWTWLGITARESDVLMLVAQGLANREIAARLHVSPRTVEKHVESLLRKAGARSRTQLVAITGPQHPGGS
jgi:DNA-binding CsgD family transcriptional regulator